MRQRWSVLIGIAVGMASTCAFAETGKAVIKGTAEGSEVTGTAVLQDTLGGLQVTVQVAHVPPGQHGLHIHQYGDCGEKGNAAGGHYNPSNTPHGFLPKDGPANAHAGDFGNIIVGPDGSGTLSLTLPPGVTLTGGPHSVAGRAIVLHEKTDDFGQPTGNAGGRIGCGPVLLTKD